MIQLTLTLDNLDYDALLDRFLPQLQEKLRETGNPVGMLLSNGMPASMAKGIVHALPQEKKDALAADLLNAYRQKLMDQMEELAHSQGIHVDVVDAKASAK